ncbi:unnamed protein product [Moneuplotes crassus]|uniref:Transmembrane protein 198 n=3 Tax=Euplotes crassus TaxID=5936 RepID=A0AAD1U655_EUPCR|nr:unnamed protein product [Moneuplotes crassus]
MISKRSKSWLRVAVISLVLLAMSTATFTDNGKTFESCIYESEDLNDGKTYSFNYLSKDVFNYSNVHHLGAPIHTYFLSNQFSVKVNVCGKVGTCGEEPSMAVLQDQKGSNQSATDKANDCYSLGDVKTEEYVKFNSWNREEEHLILKFESNDKCPYSEEGKFKPSESNSKTFKLDVEMKCDPTMTILNKPVITTNEEASDFDICHPKIIVKSSYGCKISKLETVAVFFNTFAWLIGVIFIVFGLYNLMLGGRMFRLTIILFSIASTIAITCLVFFFFIQMEDVPQKYILLILFSSGSIGALLGYFLVKTIKFGIFIIGCWTGVVLAISLDSLIFSQLGVPYILYIMIAIFVITFGWLACKYYEYVLIFSSSILGAYFFIRGISLEFGGYPNELDILEQVKHGAYVEIPWTFYLYFLAMVLCFLVGVYIQVKRLSKDEGEKREIKVEKKDNDIELQEGKKNYDQMTDDE